VIINHYKLIIPTIPDSINDIASFGASYYDIRSMKKKWQDIAEHAIIDAVSNKDLPERFAGKIGIFFRLIFEHRRRRDDDNYYLMCKGIIDAFTKCGLIEDDNSEAVGFNGIRVQVDADRPGVFIYITEKIKDVDAVNLDDYAKFTNPRRSADSRPDEEVRAESNPLRIGKVSDAAESNAAAPDNDNGSVKPA